MNCASVKASLLQPSYSLEGEAVLSNSLEKRSVRLKLVYVYNLKYKHGLTVINGVTIIKMLMAGFANKRFMKLISLFLKITWEEFRPTQLRYLFLISCHTLHTGFNSLL